MTEPAVARCVFEGRWFTRRHLEQGEKKCMIPGLKPPFARAPDLMHS